MDDNQNMEIPSGDEENLLGEQEEESRSIPYQNITLSKNKEEDAMKQINSTDDGSKEMDNNNLGENDYLVIGREVSKKKKRS